MARLRLLRTSLQLISYSSSPALSRQKRPFDGRNGKIFKSDTQSYLTVKDVRNTLNKWMDARIEWEPQPRDRSYLLEFLPTSQQELPPRRMQDSYTEAIIPLSTELKLQNRYVTATGKLRMGRVLEDMDFFAVYIALKHIKNPKQKEGMPTPYTIVTAAVDDIEYTYEKPDVTRDVKISGKVVLVGSSSLDVLVELEKNDDNGWTKMTIAHFMMAARNSTITKSAFVNPIKPSGPEEEKEMKAAQARRLKKLEESKTSLLQQPPTSDEQLLIHDNFVKSVDLSDPSINKRILPPGHVWMEDTKLNTTVFPHPQNRNHHNTVFGGYLMRMGLELAWMAAYIYSSQKPSLRYISNISFSKPVKIDSILKIFSQVVYCEGKFMQIAVFVELYDLMTAKVMTTNSFNFTYEVQHELKPVMPRTYHEAILWLEGRRHLKNYLGE